MLTKRTNILFDEQLWQKLTNIAAAQNISVGELIRVAVREKYDQQEDLAHRIKVIGEILKLRPEPVKGTVDYKELINAGRKY